MTGRFDPTTYPGVRPPGPVLVHAGGVHELTVGATAGQPFHADRDAPVLEPGAVRFSLAYGANASPDRLVDKGLDRRGTVLLPARLAGWAPVWEGRRTEYGSVPLALVPSAGHLVDAWVLGVHADDLDALDRSEGRPADGSRAPTAAPGPPPDTYLLGRVGEVAVAGRFRLADALAYLPGPTTEVQVDGAGVWRWWPQIGQAEAVDHLDAGARCVPAPQPADPVPAGWPATPLDDLPLFVYGTLRPDQDAYGLVADLVDELGEATVPGQLYDSGRGWPAAVLDAPAEQRVHGTLLGCRDPRLMPELLARTDHYEGAPHLFRRTAVLASTVGGGRWALAYTWADRSAPGVPLPTGRW